MKLEFEEQNVRLLKAQGGSQCNVLLASSEYKCLGYGTAKSRWLPPKTIQPFLLQYQKTMS